MSEERIHTYEAVVWPSGAIWKAKVLRNGVLWSLDHEFETREDALAWAKNEADEDRRQLEEQREAERIAL